MFFPKEHGMAKAMYTFELETDMMTFMEQMVTKYDLSDVSKAMRCLVNYARGEESVREDIFEEIRCFHCD